MRSGNRSSAVYWIVLTLGSLLANGMLSAGEVMNQAPQPLPYESRVAPPQDRAFNGAIKLEVDARDIKRRMFRIKETIPVQAPGRLTLLYPEWEPSSHARTLSAANLAGLVVRAGSQRLEWRRDELDMHAFHVDVPSGAERVDVEFQYITRTGDALMRPDMVVVQWQRMLLYPAGWFARNIAVQARLRLPQGLQVVSSLQLDDAAEGNFISTSLDMLMDAPVIAARHVRSFGLGLPGEPPLRLSLLADTEDALRLTEHDLVGLRRLIKETHAVFGAAPYRHFDAMVVLSDAFPTGGSEHAESAEINLPADFFRDPSHQLNNLDLIAHEHVHAWNGRARVPAGQWTPTPNVAIRNSLLWVYEGQTEFWGRVLAARSGLRGRQETLDRLALDAAQVQAANGRAWKPLRDTVNDPLYVSSRSNVWPQWQRRKDYYTEGVLLWLEIDMTLRQRSKGRLSLDDFARQFFSFDASARVTTYGFDDVCKALNRVLPLDWSSHLNARLDAHDAVVLDGLAKAGWSLAFDPHPSETFRQHEEELGASDLTYSVGMIVTQEGIVRSVAWDSAADKAGLAPGVKLVAVNGSKFSLEHLRSSINASNERPLSIDYEMEGVQSSAELSYRGGLRYPRLNRMEGTPDRLSELLASGED